MRDLQPYSENSKKNAACNNMKNSYKANSESQNATAVGWIMAPQRYPRLNRWEFVTLDGKRDFADVIEDLEMKDYPGLYG